MLPADMRNYNEKDVVWILAKGTIDSVDYESTPQLVSSLDESLIPKYMWEKRSNTRYCFYNLNNPHDDSKEYSDKELREMLDLVKDIHQTDKAQNFVISFGTDAMVKLGRMAKEYFDKNDMNNVSMTITGSMEPLVFHYNGKSSDATLNLDTIDKQASSNGLKKGVSILMHGKYFRPEVTAKDIINKQMLEVENPINRERIEREHELSFSDRYNLYAAKNVNDETIKKGR
jgi:L-asparaginase/Glu-tRNA(Gln) amidotransferase subunit D